MEILEIAKRIEQTGGNLYLVGGAVRDKLLGKACYDEDFCVTGLSKEEFEKIFPESVCRGKAFPVYEIEGKEFALARKEKKIDTGHKGFEIETGKEITIEEDLQRRDITINAIAEEVLTGKIIDPFDGKKDIEKKKIRMVSRAFKEDPLRVYRVARFAANLEFEVEEQTIKQMKVLRQELNTLSAERVFMEFKKALGSKKPSIFFQILRKAQVLDVHFKEIYDLIGSLQPKEYHPEGDSYNHTMLVVDYSTVLTQDLSIRFACLVHDLGKGVTPKEMQPHHYGHDEKGVSLVESLGKRLVIPKKWIECGKTAAKYHMKGGIFNQMTAAKQVDFITNVQKSKLGLEGMKIVVLCDKNRTGAFPTDIMFEEIGKKCLEEVTGKCIIEKYKIEGGKEVQERLRQERIAWIKNNKEKFKKKLEKIN